MIKLTPFIQQPVYFTDEEGNKWATVVNVNCASTCCVCGKWFTSGYAKLTPEYEDTGSLSDVEGYYCAKEVEVKDAN